MLADLRTGPRNQALTCTFSNYQVWQHVPATVGVVRLALVSIGRQRLAVLNTCRSTCRLARLRWAGRRPGLQPEVDPFLQVGYAGPPRDHGVRGAAAAEDPQAGLPDAGVAALLGYRAIVQAVLAFQHLRPPADRDGGILGQPGCHDAAGGAAPITRW